MFSVLRAPCSVLRFLAIYAPMLSCKTLYLLKYFHSKILHQRKRSRQQPRALEFRGRYCLTC